MRSPWLRVAAEDECNDLPHHLRSRRLAVLASAEGSEARLMATKAPSRLHRCRLEMAEKTGESESKRSDAEQRPRTV